MLLSRNKTCERCFMCRSVEFCKNVTNVPPVVPNLPVGARLHQFWKKWAALGVSPKVLTVLREGYTLPFRLPPNLTRSPTITSYYVNPHRNLYLLEALHQVLNKNAVELVKNQQSLGFYNRLFLVRKTQQPVETYLGPQYPEQIFQDRVIQNGDTRENNNLSMSKGKGYLHRFQRRIPPHTNKQSVQEVHGFHIKGKTYQFKALPFYCVNISYLVDQCICPARSRSRQTLDKNVLSWALTGTGSVFLIRQVS